MEGQKLGYEILQILSANEIITWMALDITQEEFDAIELPQGWFKNQPREGEADAGEFAKSPGAPEGEFTIEEHFGHLWRHVATIRETGVAMDEEGLLTANSIEKHHKVTFYAGKTLQYIISPEGDRYVRISRDARRSQEVPTIPSNWQQMESGTSQSRAS